MSGGGGRRGRRGGRRQRRRDEQARQGHAAAAVAPPTKPNGQSGPGHPVIPTAEVVAPPAPAPVVAPPAMAAPPAPVAAPPAMAPPAAVAPPAPTAPPATAPAAHPRPMSARELVARLEAKHAHEAAAAAELSLDAAGLVATEPTEVPADASAAVAAAPAHVAEPRRFRVNGVEWVATLAGRGTGGTGRVAPARIEAVRFSTVAEPEQVAAEVLLPHARLDDLYDDELAELLERGLRSRTGNG